MTRNKILDEVGRTAALDRYCIIELPSEAAFDKITALVREVLEVPICAVSLIDRDRQWFKSIQGLDVSETPRDIAFCAHTILGHKPMVIGDAMTDTRFVANPLVTGQPGIRSYAGVPLCSPDGYNLGSLCAIDTRPRDFSQSQIGILSSFGRLVVDEMELRTIAHRDFLTNTATRRAFIQAAEQEIARARRYRRPSSLLMFDLDHFKVINDSFGHAVGDEVLKSVAATCLAMLRPNDVLGRLGGEEFGVLLPETEAPGAMAMAERLRAAISALKLGSMPELKVTASVGVAPLRSQPTPERWLSVADAALYRAKREGRNKAVLADPSTPRLRAA